MMRVCLVAPAAEHPHEMASPPMPMLSPAGRHTFDMLSSRLCQLHYPHDNTSAKSRATTLDSELHWALAETNASQSHLSGSTAETKQLSTEPPSPKSVMWAQEASITSDDDSSAYDPTEEAEVPPTPPPRKRLVRAQLALSSPQHAQRSWILVEERRSLTEDLLDEWDSEEDLDSTKRISSTMSVSLHDTSYSDILLDEPSWSAGADELTRDTARKSSGPKSPGPKSPGPKSPRAKSPGPRPHALSWWDSFDLSRGKWLRARQLRRRCRDTARKSSGPKSPGPKSPRAKSPRAKSPGPRQAGGIASTSAAANGCALFACLRGVVHRTPMHDDSLEA